ncbi:MAG: tetratricopeptide repeat protein [Candidatus Latescibacterota bacterium]|nr:MAG: tetratricopeptide repeat protein [Candidatus Latescibacterota bacterium]
MRSWVRRERFALTLVALAAVGRAACIGATHDDPLFRVPYLDGAFYHVWARSLAQGVGDFQGPYFLAPLYPHALSWLYRLFGADPFVARVAQSVLGVVDVALLYLVARHLFGVLAGTLATVLFALYGTLLLYEGLLVLEPLLLTLLLSAFCALVLMRGSARALVSGAALGAATVARGTALLAAPVVVWALWNTRASGRSASLWRREIALCFAVWFLVLLPVLVRNHRAGGGVVLTTNVGVNFYAGNGPGANGRFRQPPGVQFFTAPLAHVARQDASLPSALAERALTVEAVAGTKHAADSSAWLARSWSWIQAQPTQFLFLLARKAGLVLQSREIGQIESPEFHRQRLAPLRLFFVDLLILLPLAAFGASWALRQRRPGTSMVLGFAIATLLPCVLFFVTARYRVSAVPYLALLAGVGAATLVEWGRARRWGLVVAAGLLLLLLALLTRVGAAPPRSAPGWQNAQMAERVYAIGDLDGAIRYQEAAAQWLPNRMEVQLNLALYWSERNRGEDLARAEQVLRRLLERDPRQPVVLFNLGVILEQAGRVDEAARAWRETLRLEPQFTPARERLRQLQR